MLTYAVVPLLALTQAAQWSQPGVLDELLKNPYVEGGKEEKLPPGWEGMNGGHHGEHAESDPAVSLNDSRLGSIKIMGLSGSCIWNDGYGGIPLQKGGKYHLTIWVKAGGRLAETPLTFLVGLASHNWGQIELLKERTWHKFVYTFASPVTTMKGRFSIGSSNAPTWIGYASLMPMAAWKQQQKHR